MSEPLFALLLCATACAVLLPAASLALRRGAS